jgi:hypothetical protein
MLCHTTEEPHDQRVWAAFFLDEDTGYAAPLREQFVPNHRRGQTWQGVVATLPGGIDTQLKFADHGTGKRKGRSRLGRTLTVAPPLDFTSLRIAV